MYSVKYLIIKGLVRVKTCTMIFQNMMFKYCHLKATKTVLNRMFLLFCDLFLFHVFSSYSRATAFFWDLCRSPYCSTWIFFTMFVNFIKGLVQLKQRRLQHLELYWTVLPWNRISIFSSSVVIGFKITESLVEALATELLQRWVL